MNVMFTQNQCLWRVPQIESTKRISPYGNVKFILHKIACRVLGRGFYNNRLPSCFRSIRTIQTFIIVAVYQPQL